MRRSLQVKSSCRVGVNRQPCGDMQGSIYPGQRRCSAYLTRCLRIASREKSSSHNSSHSFDRKGTMKKVLLAVLLFGFCLTILSLGKVIAADKGPVDAVLHGCKSELETFCRNVTPGEGRLLACLYAYEDQLSGRCDYALYDASAQLERAVAAL